MLSPEIMEEYQRVASVLADIFRPIDLRDILAIVQREAEFHVAPALPMPVCDDPDDDKFLACAIAPAATVIVSGDKYLLRVSDFQGVKVIKPRIFLETYLS